MRRVTVGVLFGALAVAAACGGGDGRRGGTPPPDGGGGTDGATTGGDIRIEPADHEVALVAGVAAEVDYRAFVPVAGGGEREVTAEVEWSSTVTTLGTFTGSHFTSAVDLGGVTSIRARMGDLLGSTSLTLRLSRTIVAEGAGADAPTRFASATPGGTAPEVVYPEDGVMVPPNLGELELHFRPNGGTVFELAFVSSAADLRIYFGCPESVGGGCVYTPDRETWEVIATAAQGAGPSTYTLRSLDASGSLGEAAARTITVAEEPITGGLYYWNAGGGTIDRFEFGVRGAVAERFLTQGQAGATTCIGCHALSRDGRRIAIGSDIPTTTFQVFDVASRTRVFSQGGGGGIGAFPSQPNFYSFNADASQIVSSSAMGLHIRSGTTGEVTAGPFGGGPSEMPDWSPEGDHIVYVKHAGAGVSIGLYDYSSVQSGEIRRLDWNGSEWVAGPTLVAAPGVNNYYPTYSPDGRWVVFNRSPSNVPSMGADPDTMAYVPDAELWAIVPDGASAAIPLAPAGGLADSWPKFDPTTYQDNGRTIFWLAWSSRRAFGLRGGEGENPQLWMAAFSPDGSAPGGNLIYPAFRLPFQSAATGNHIAQWVTKVERQSCSTDVECNGEFCVDGRCYESPPLI